MGKWGVGERGTLGKWGVREIRSTLGKRVVGERLEVPWVSGVWVRDQRYPG